MNKNNPSLHSNVLKSEFNDRELVTKTELRNLYKRISHEFDKNAFRRNLYSLEKEKTIIPIGSGIYGLANSSRTVNKKIYKPIFSKTTQDINSILKQTFPYTSFLLWETRGINDLMIHQPYGNQIILEVDKEAVESAFNELRQRIDFKVFLQPDQVISERYIINSNENIILLGLITDSPKVKVNGIASAKLEKILVDIFSDNARFFIYHGQEMINIFENAFSTYWINPKTLFRYADRRNQADELTNFLRNKTTIDIDKISEKII